MASNTTDNGESVQQALLQLLGEETYRDYFEPDHTPSDVHYHTRELERERELLAPANSAFEEGGAGNNWDMDSILIEAIKQFESSQLDNTYEAKTASAEGRFATPKSEEDVEKARKARIPKKTQADTRYCVEIWKTWSNYRNSVVKNEQVNEDVTSLDNNSLQYWLMFWK